MAGTAAELTKLLNAVMTQIKKLNDDQASALADGSAELRYIPKMLLKQFNQFAKLSEDQLQQLADGEAEYRLVPKTLTAPFNKLSKLSEEQLQQLANQEAEFKFVPKAASKSKEPPPTGAEVHRAMLAAPDQVAARDYFGARKWTAAELKNVMKELDLPTATKMDTMIDTIIKVFVTGRLTTSAVRF